MARESTLLSISLVIEEDATVAARCPNAHRFEEEIRKAVLAAVATIVSDRPDVRVAWSSLNDRDFSVAGVAELAWGRKARESSGFAAHK